jgi:hypothetical protein
MQLLEVADCSSRACSVIATSSRSCGRFNRVAFIGGFVRLSNCATARGWPECIRPRVHHEARPTKRLTQRTSCGSEMLRDVTER